MLNPEATPFLPAIAGLPTLPDAALISTLDLLFEPAAELHALALPTLRRTISFSSYPDLIATIRDMLLAIVDGIVTPDDDDEDETRTALHGILGSHPRLGEKKKETLSAQSKGEQAHLVGDSEEVAERLKELNKEYEDRFPGLRYVVFVNGRGRAEIMEDMRRRIDRGNVKMEEREGVEAMCAIANDRAAKLPKSAQEASGSTK
ncbi:Oxo-4-hydroxy-4-carboxy-5-ureidoimidazoline decarboxylase [Bombardia bombarda]|uniref:Oxo-4-hydroxy-4-carboxy-5-ureidoimidazoline decarboxylase n=1 Tax=Bombardia bombarda TaxID=252184 RepID=A0AA39T0P4_9PEZI|nr:Oxo-4-hydroxy-4-carboxy-5-ureidoimidazoline decarboxylase [Bombardia bombarda]